MGVAKMSEARKCKESAPPVSRSSNEQALPLLPMILAGVLAGAVAAAFALLSGYGLVMVLIFYAICGAAVTLLLSLALYKLSIIRAESGSVCSELVKLFYKLIAIRANYNPIAIRAASDSKGGELLELKEWLVHRNQDNTDPGLHQKSWVMFVAGKTKRAHNVRNMLTDEGFSVASSECLQDAALTILDDPDRWELMCVDLDAYDGVKELDSVFEELASFHRTASSVPVMLMSHHF
ncbi:hypothetical protein [uncultured Tateyamaria sp.]|uniref:hypothetical protein n=1 Tax=uncultured Tateyamaria sp. TaxID=455651 RepID=UPI00262C667E|nr:hypothetical protein [uncultured Tateyamaria sp.]